MVGSSGYVSCPTAVQEASYPTGTGATRDGGRALALVLDERESRGAGHGAAGMTGSPALAAADTAGSGGSIKVLIVEDDPGDALLVQELLADSDDLIETIVARTVAAAKRLVVDEVACVLLDLGLPDAQGLTALEELLAVAPDAAVVVLTGLGNRALALAAVRAGAQDYLAKDEIDVSVLTRSIRYAIERKRSDEAARRLLAHDLVTAERVRLERGLLPRPLLSGTALDWASRYRPGGGALLLGGDFFDAVDIGQGRVRVVIGDVCGHGPDEAALGVALRIAWRSLVLAGVADGEILVHLQALLTAERSESSLFVTVCDATIDTTERRLSVRMAGHPPPLQLTARLSALGPVAVGPPLGVVEDAGWPTSTVELGPQWGLLFYTDGIVEGRCGRGSLRWGIDGMLEAASKAPEGLDRLTPLADHLIASAEQANGGPLPDDIALFAIAELRA
jgi:serine phosphatase RsbU (regulator of sigma subunit)